MQKHSQKNIQTTSTKELNDIILDRCLKYLSIRPRSEHEMTQYINKNCTKYKVVLKDINTITQHIIRLLKKASYIDDYAFVEWWVDNRSFSKPKGKRALFAELKTKRIPELIIKQYFEKNYFDEHKLAIKAVEKKTKGKKLSETQRNKLYMFLLRRGFSYDVSRKTIDLLRNEE